MAQGSQSEGERVGVAVAQGEGAEVDDVATGVCFPAAVGALEAHLDQTLAGGLDAAGADGEAEPSHHLMPACTRGDSIPYGLLHGALFGLLAPLAVPDFGICSTACIPPADTARGRRHVALRPPPISQGTQNLLDPAPFVE